MAGTYADVPGRRWMYDQDGTLVYVSPNQATSPLTAVNTALINDEEAADWVPMLNSGFSAWREITFVFPQARTLLGRNCGVNPNASNSPLLQINTIRASTNTTDGVDGTWTDPGITAPTSVSNNLPATRTGIVAVNVPNITGFRFRIANNNSITDGRLEWLHLYGTISPTLTTDRLEFWHNTSDVVMPAAHLDFGDLALTSATTKSFRIKNLSTTKTASSVVISRDNDAGGSTNTVMITGLQFSTDGTTWANTVNIASLAPGAISSVIQVRRTVANNETGLTPRFARLKAVAGTFA